MSHPTTCESPNKFCARINPDLRIKLCTICIPVEYRKYKKLYSPTLRPRILIMKKGFAARKVLLPDGKHICLAFSEPNDVVGPLYNDREVKTFDHKASFNEVLKPIEGGLIATSDLRGLCGEYPILNKVFLAAAEDRWAKMVEHTFRLASCTSSEKVAYALSLMEQNEIGYDELTHEDIAAILNMNRVTVTKAMKTVLSTTT